MVASSALNGVRCPISQVTRELGVSRMNMPPKDLSSKTTETRVANNGLKKAYSRPTLTAHGSVRQMTRNSGATGDDLVIGSTV